MRVPDDPDGERLHGETLRGDFERALSARETLPPAWAELIAREHALAVGAQAPTGGRHAPDAPGAARLAVFIARTRVTGFEPAPLPAPPDDPVAGPLVAAWTSLGRGEADVPLDEAAAEARRRAQPDLVVECTALAALQAARRGETREALKRARRASRMARTESLPQVEYLAGLVLARMRRLAGHPHLAGRILESLAPLVSTHWRPWLDWERVLAGASEATTDAATAILEARRAAMDARPDALSDALARAKAGLSAFHSVAADADALDSLLRPGDASSVALGVDEERPFAAFAGDAYVVCVPTGPGRRVRAASLPLESATLVGNEDAKQRRIATLTSVLGLASGALGEAVCFERVYGFAYVPEMHRGSFDVLLHRARAALEGLATIERQGAEVRMGVLRPFAVPDPRMTEPAEARILRAVAAGGSTARNIAEATGLSLRQTQMLLKSLAEEGECAVERQGRVLHYKVEDTTFSEPTRVSVR